MSIRLLYKKEKGFTLIELLIVVSIIGVLTAVSIPGYIGIQERGRRGAVIKAAEQSASELQAWIHAARSIGPDALATGIDTDGNGQIQAGVDLNNAGLTALYANVDGLCVRYAANKAIKPDVSPWNPGLLLWKTGGPAPRQIDCSHLPFGFITITVQDNSATTIYTKLVAAD
ncbi:MAG: prepilin-type N-terminal cleavage/methylation domain-containing protein [Nitrospiraceae bacterium]|nr:MAG: prepilin-type N-terminal cleavage/methylation domain-containing protein [Nitrospiraceae bacterium]